MVSGGGSPSPGGPFQISTSGHKSPKRLRRGVIDTSVVVAGVAGFKAGVTPTNESAKLIPDWIRERYLRVACHR